MTATASFRALTLSASPGKPEMNERGRYRYVYRVSIASDATGVTRRFTFHASEADYKKGKRGLGPDDLLWAFRCFVDDAATGEASFLNFCEELGYDADSRSHYSTWQACRAAGDKFRALWHREVSVYDVLIELTAMGVE